MRLLSYGDGVLVAAVINGGGSDLFFYCVIRATEIHLIRNDLCCRLSVGGKSNEFYLDEYRKKSNQKRCVPVTTIELVTIPRA